MSKLTQLRKKVRYESAVPRCETCKEYKKPYIYLTTNSRTKESNPQCKLLGFSVAKNGCCDMWIATDGSSFDNGAQLIGVIKKMVKDS